MAIKYAKIHSALVKTKMYSDLGNDDMEEVNEKGKKVAPELFDNNRLKRFQEEFLPALKIFVDGLL